MNKQELAAAFKVSVNTVTEWIHKGCPVERRGRNGHEYSFNLESVVAWRQQRLSERLGLIGGMDLLGFLRLLMDEAAPGVLLCLHQNLGLSPRVSLAGMALCFIMLRVVAADRLGAVDPGPLPDILQSLTNPAERACLLRWLEKKPRRFDAEAADDHDDPPPDDPPQALLDAINRLMECSRSGRSQGVA